VIYVECNPDKLLLKTLGVLKKHIVHAGGKSNICKQLEKHKNCKALIDKDPGSPQPPYIKKLKINEVHSREKIEILKDEKNNNIVIMLDPRLEGWIIYVAKQVKISLERYGLSNDEGRLHRIINTNLNNFKRLLDKLKQTEPLKLLENKLQ